MFLFVLFSLIQSSQSFYLNERSQNFFFHLLIELSLPITSMNSPATRTLHTIVMDLIFILLQRQNSQKFPQNFRDLITVIDIIHALTDKSKQKEYPKQLFERSRELLGENLKLTKDDIENSNESFDTKIDLQLIKLMNEHPSMNNSLNQFIMTLPTESKPDPLFYQNYPLLSNIPTTYIQTRAKLFYQFNIFVENIVFMFDFSLLPGQSILLDYIRMVKIYLLKEKKFQWLNQSLLQTESGSIAEILEVKFDTIKANIHDHDSENTMFHQAFEQLHENAHSIFRLKNEFLWRAKYVDMHSTDLGGAYRDSITAICSDICSTRLPLFILCPNGQTNNGLNRDCWIPNAFPPNKPILNKFKKQYQFIGQLIGMAIRKKHYLNLKFPLLFWKQLIGEEITIKDIEAIDIQSFAIIKEMENYIEKNQLIDSDTDINYLFDSILSELQFDIISSSGQTYELIPGGQDIPVTAKNFKEYSRCYREYRLNEFHRQIEFIRQGLCSVMPSHFLTLFTANELEEAVCGKGQIDVLLLKRNTIYISGFNENSPHIQKFWTVLNERFDEEQKKLFLIFVWGRSTLPIKDEDFTSKFIIQTIVSDDHEPDKMLPSKSRLYLILSYLELL
jgi:hypothetical protein